jgi:hypothetical protein
VESTNPLPANSGLSDMNDKEFRCGTEHYNELLFPDGYENNITPIEEQFNELNNGSFNKDQIYNIPVVFHVVYHKDTENIEKKQILEQIEVINKDFRNKNTGDTLFSKYTREKGLATDSQIEFTIAKKDPQGNPTEGITKRYTEHQFFIAPEGGESGDLPLDQQPVKSTKLGGRDAWDTKRYLNVWICNLSNAGGYAQYPRSDPSLDLCLTDGIVVDYTRIGLTGTATPPYNKGRTLTHEIGHWLGLYHLWGRTDSRGCFENDRIEDTPPQSGPQKGKLKGYSDELKCRGSEVYPLVLNHMDFWYDEFALMFTKGQVEKMQNILRLLRNTVFS